MTKFIYHPIMVNHQSWCKHKMDYLSEIGRIARTLLPMVYRDLYSQRGCVPLQPTILPINFLPPFPMAKLGRIMPDLLLIVRVCPARFVKYVSS